MRANRFLLSHCRCIFLNLLRGLQHRAKHTQRETLSTLFHIQELRGAFMDSQFDLPSCLATQEQATHLTDNYIPDIQLSSDMGTSRYIKPLLYRPLKGNKQKNKHEIWCHSIPSFEAQINWIAKLSFNSFPSTFPEYRLHLKKKKKTSYILSTLLFASSISLYSAYMMNSSNYCTPS